MASSVAVVPSPSTSSPGRARSGHRVQLIRRQRRFAVALSAPALIPIIAFAIVPLGAAVGLSLTSYDMFTTPTFVGLRNYRQLFDDPVFWTAVRNTLGFALSQVVIGVVVVVAVALLFSQSLHGGALMRTVVYLPQAASYVVVALVWNLLLDPLAGPISQVAQVITGHQLSMLTSSDLAMPAIVVVSLWRNLGYFMVIVLAALQAVPRELLEAAEVDGAGPVSRFRWVTVPEIAPAVVFVAITWFLGALQMFTQSYVMTGGGPVNATRTVVYIMYDQAFGALRLGTASAIAVLLFASVVVVSVALRLIGRRLS